MFLRKNTLLADWSSEMIFSSGTSSFEHMCSPSWTICHTNWLWECLKIDIGRKTHVSMNITFMISGSCHGPLSERMQLPSFVQVQVPPKNSGSSLPTYKKMHIIKLKTEPVCEKYYTETMALWPGNILDTWHRWLLEACFGICCPKPS